MLAIAITPWWCCVTPPRPYVMGSPPPQRPGRRHSVNAAGKSVNPAAGRGMGLRLLACARQMAFAPA
jgi:hypothetical protein